MNRRVSLFAIALMSGTGIVGCAKQDLYFATSSNVGLDVAGDAATPVQASVGFQRREVAMVPASASGEAFPVYGNLDVDMRWFGDRVVRQVFATGEAATNSAIAHAADEEALENFEEAVPECEGRHCKPLIFASHSIVGIHVGTGSAPQPASFSLGYKRVEATWIPTDAGAERTRSVYGDISVNTCGFSGCGQAPADAKDAVKVKATVTGGVRLSQTIATGPAAIAITQQEDAKKSLQDATQIEIAEIEPAAPAQESLEDAVAGQQ